MAGEEKGAVIDIESELTCSICTEILYQPLTLLDCLHTFCGSCLKEWFSWQGSQAKNAKESPFHCPSCRAPVRETRPNATVTTLLDIYLKANPGKDRSEEEKESLAQAYKTGDNVLPKFKKKKETRQEAAERRLIEETTELSLREVGIQGSAPQRRRRNDAAESLREERLMREAGGEWPRPSRIPSGASRASQIGHQNSLRSILSSSDLGDAADIEEEILKQIMDDGILDGIDLNHLSVAQEEELTEKIADAYRRRHRRRRSKSRDNRSPPAASETQPQDPAAEQRRERRQGRSSQPPNSPSSSHSTDHHPRLLDPGYPTEQRHRRTISSEHRSQTSPTPSPNQREPTNTRRTAARSATDLTNSPQRSDSPSSLKERPNQARSRTDSERLQPRSSPNDRLRQKSHSPARARHTSSRGQSYTPGSPKSDHGKITNSSSSAIDTSASQPQGTVQSPTIITTSPHGLPVVPHDATSPLQQFDEPSIICRRCGKTDLEYELHWNCRICEDGKYDLCQRCYRGGKGCLHWFGFGPGSLQKYQRQAPPEGHPANNQPPHRLQGHKYIPPPTNSLVNRQTPSNPTSRLQSGPFCSNCSAFSPTYFWQCETCNEGEWGFCNICVNQGRCCTHALLPAAVTSYLKSPPISPTLPGVRPTNQDYRWNNNGQDYFTTLSISTHCDQCRYPIPPSTTRYHCPICNDGDYDLCSACYFKLFKRGTISADDGPKGWRKCPNGHRMIIVGFEDSIHGQRRIVVEDLVGGHALSEADAVFATSNAPLGSQAARQGSRGWQWQENIGEVRIVSRSTTALVSPTQGKGKGIESQNAVAEGKTFPPSGGVGMRVLALWGYWPLDGVQDELAFPRGAEITECEDINGDWFWGIYCARKGLFPGAYGRVVGKVGI